MLTEYILFLFINLRLPLISLLPLNVFGKQVATVSMWPPPKLTKKPKNRSLISQQQLYNKF
jgi:hypothetical protein